MSRLFRALFSFDRRPATEVEEDIRAELEAHLALLEAELRSQAVEADAARAQALTRFGDPARLVRAGTHIKLGDRIMLQRINLALLVVLGAAVVFLLVQNQRINARSVTTLEQLNASLARLEVRGADSTETAGPPVKVAYVRGLVVHPGTFTIPPGGLTLKRLVAMAGGISAGGRTIYVDKDRAGKEVHLVLSTSTYDSDIDHSLDPGDVVTVSDREDDRAPTMLHVTVRGFVSSPDDMMIPQSEASLATLLQQALVQPQAASVRIERGGAQPMSRDLKLGEARGVPGKDLRLAEGDTITVLGAETAEPAPDWMRFKRSPELAKLMNIDATLVALVEEREGRDDQAAQKLKKGYPVQHQAMLELREKTQQAESLIVQRVAIIRKPELERLVVNDPSLANLVAKLEESDEKFSQAAIRVGRPSTRAQFEHQQERTALQAQVNARVEELLEAENK